MRPMPCRIRVKASRTYDVLVGGGVLASVPKHIQNAFGSKTPKTLCLVSDDTVWNLYGSTLEATLEESGFRVHKFVFPHGERSKTLHTAGELLEFLAENQLTRTDALIALGGGVVGDLTGFAAATYLRGLPFVQIPTTLLAAVDSSVGGKTGVNLSTGKNLAGAFWQPSLVLFDPETTKTLPKECWVDGLAEAIKAGVLGDANLIAFISGMVGRGLAKGETAAAGRLALSHLVIRAVEIKKTLVEADERDKSARQLLNLGHTVGHAIESCSGFALSHGHGVAMGMAIEARGAEVAGWCDALTVKTIVKAVEGLGVSMTCPYSASELTAAALRDKKRTGDRITLAVPKTLGEGQLKTIPISQLQDFIKKGLSRKELL